MKVLLYTESEKQLKNSGLGHALMHQMEALETQGIEYTTDPNDSYDIAHINYYLLNSYLLAQTLKLRNIPIVYHAHSTEEDFRNSFLLSNQIAPAFKKWLITCYSLGDAVVTPTPYAKKILLNYGITSPIYSISNGINLKEFSKEPTFRNEFRKEFDYSDEDIIILGIGLYIERKGILDFIELAKKMPEYKFIWFGYTNPNLLPDKINNAIDEAKTIPNIKLPGYHESNTIKKALAGCDIYIFPTHEETEGIPILEASAMKTPMIIRDIPVFEDWLIDKEHVYKAKDNDEFIELIRLMVNHKLDDLTENAYNIAKERDLTIIGKQLKDVYMSLLKK